MYRGVLFSFLKGKYFPIFKLKDASKKFVSVRFVSIVMDSPSVTFLNKLIMSLLIYQVLGHWVCVLLIAHRLYIAPHC